jgi:hypothetical protein
MATTLTSDISRMLVAGVTDVFTKNFDSFPLEYPFFTTNKMAKKEEEIYDSVGNIGAASQKTENDSIQYRKIEQAYQTKIKNKTWANGISFTMESDSYDLYGVVSETRAKELARTMREAEESRAIRWIDNATSAAYALADGQPLATNSRPLKNLVGTFNDTLATTSSLNDPENHKTMIKMFPDFKNHAGGPFKTYPTKGMTHRTNMADIEEIYASQNKANEFSNTKNVLNGSIDGLTSKKISWGYSTYMTSTTAWMMWDDTIEHILFQWYKKTYLNSYEDVKDTLNLYVNAVALYETGCLPNIGFVYNQGS